MESDKVKILELFCGTKSISNEFKQHGCDVFTVDFDNQHNPDLCIDILDFDVSMLPWIPDVIWASPDCRTWSIAACGHHWNKDKTPMNIEVSYDKDNENWVLSNTDIMVYGRGTKLSDAEISFADGFERLLIGFLMFENDELSPKSQKIKKDLEKHINIEKYTHLINFE